MTVTRAGLFEEEAQETFQAERVGILIDIRRRLSLLALLIASELVLRLLSYPWP